MEEGKLVRRGRRGGHKVLLATTITMLRDTTTRVLPVHGSHIQENPV
jgi:hypothetical protein